MSIPGINGITGASLVATTVADTPTATAPVRLETTAAQVGFDQVTQQPLPPRFPWLSRLSQQLEHAARQKPAFAPAPILGDNLDRSV